MNWTTEYLELLAEYAKLCNVEVVDMKRHIDTDSLGLKQFKTWSDCL